MKAKVFSLFLAAAFTIMAAEATKLKIYMVVTMYDYHRVVHKVYLSKEKAQKYVDAYKENHNYALEEMTLDE